MIINNIVFHLGNTESNLYRLLQELSKTVDRCLLYSGSSEEEIFNAVSTNLQSLFDAQDTELSSKINLIYTGETEDAVFRRLSVKIPETAKKIVEQKIAIPGLSISNFGVIMLPRGQTDNAAASYAWLKEINSLNVYKKIFLVFPYNYSPDISQTAPIILSSNEHARLVIEIIRQMFNSDVLSQIDRFITEPSEKFMSAGICTVEFPAEDIINQNTHQFSISLLGHYIQKQDVCSPQEIEEFVTDSHLSMARVYEKIVSWDKSGDNMITKIGFEPVLFNEIPLEYLPKQIANYGDYLANQVVRKFAKRVDSNYSAIQLKITEVLFNKLGSIIADRDNPSVDKADRFLQKLRERIEKESDYLERFVTLDGIEEEIYGHPVNRAYGEASDPKLCYDNLVKHIENRPLWVAILARYLLLGMISGFALRKFIDILTMSKSIINLGFLSSGWIWFFLCFLFCLGIGALVFIRSRLAVRKSRDRYMQAILDKQVISIKNYIKTRMQQLYRIYLATIEKPEDEQIVIGNSVITFTEKLAIFRNALQKIKCKIEKDEPEPQYRNRFKESILSYLDNDITFPYKSHDRVDWDNELRGLAGTGIFDEWSELASREDLFMSTLMGYVRSGYEYISKISLFDLLKSIPDDKNRDMMKKLMETSLPYIVPISFKTDKVEFLFYPETEEAIVKKLNLPETVQKMPSYMSDRLSVFQIAWNISPRSVKLFSYWSKSYEGCEDKASLHNVENWENLLDPLAEEPGTDESRSQKESETGDESPV